MHYCRKHYLILGFLIVLSSLIKAQDTLSSAGVETQSYSLYIQKNWDELIRFGNVALSKGFDYYYLRYRLGAAYFEKKKYRNATIQFEKANKFNSTDETMEYLYYCYLYTGQYERARWISKSFSPDAVAYTGSDKLKSFSFATLEGGMRTSDSTIQFQTSYYLQAGLGHFINNRFSLFHALTYLNQSDFRGTTNQYQYYLGATIPLKNDWTLLTGIQPIYRNTIPLKNVVKYVHVTLPPKKGGPPMGKDTIVARDTTQTGSPVNKLNFVFAIGISKAFSNFDISLGLAIGVFDSTSQYQHSLSISYHPLGNNKLIVGCAGFMHTENYYKSNHYAVLPSLYVEPAKILSLSITYLANNQGSLIENNGYIVNSNPDPMVARFSVLANITLSKCISIYGAYQEQDNVEYHKHWPFYYDLFITGIKYIPK